ncbi:MAG: hypothetical protein LBS57_01075 [Treponema sp.]|nr:hypothetical protein [Treponema sp.]
MANNQASLPPPRRKSGGILAFLFKPLPKPGIWGCFVSGNYDISDKFDKYLPILIVLGMIVA